MSPRPSSAALPSLAGAPWLMRADTQAVLGALAAAGHAGRVVGGAVRNTLLGEPVTDVDIATPARPEQVTAAARAAGLTCVPTGLAHGTVTVIAGHVPHEVTTLRRDVETFGRHATVAFTDDWSADAHRRDFTMNALYCEADGTLHDLVGGYPDLLARRVRFIGDPGERIREDFLRILRFFRFAAQYGRGTLDAAGLAAAVREREGLRRLSGERVHAEFVKLIVAPDARAAIEAMHAHGLLVEVLARAPRPVLFTRVLAIETAIAAAPDPMLRLAALAVWTGEDAAALAARLRLSNREAARLAEAATHPIEVDPAAGEQAQRSLLYRLGPDRFRAALLLAHARAGTPSSDPRIAAQIGLPERWPPPRFPLTGADVVALGVPAGPEIGELLRRLETAWIAADFVPGRAVLLADLDRLVGRRPPSANNA